jgi:mannan endo-1,6-alpha-mannosidase
MKFFRSVRPAATGAAIIAAIAPKELNISDPCK